MPASIRTWLSLEEFRVIFGMDPFGFWQFSSPTLRTNTQCGEVFFEYDWQHSARVGRDSIVQAIAEAEQEIAREVGYNLLPDWTVAERLPYPQPSDPSIYGIGVNPRWMGKSIELPRGHVIAGGVRTKAVILAGAAVTRTDADGDGYQELCTITVPTTVTDLNEFHVYYPAKNGADEWEIRPLRSVAIVGANVVITFYSWQIPAANQLENMVATSIDADVAGNYESTVDLYRVYNDPATQVQLIWEPSPVDIWCCGQASCYSCQLNTQAGCFHLRDPRMGFAVPSPASWDSATQQFNTSMLAGCREPDQVRFWYYSGWQNQNLSRPLVQLDPYWKTTIAYYAASKFDRDVCGCSNVNQLIGKWRRDMAYAQSSATGGESFQETAEIMGNRFGTTAGAINAYRRVRQNGVAVNK